MLIFIHSSAEVHCNYLKFYLNFISVKSLTMEQQSKNEVFYQFT